jgi:hypothetical protein
MTLARRDKDFRRACPYDQTGHSVPRPGQNDPLASREKYPQKCKAPKFKGFFFSLRVARILPLGLHRCGPSPHSR